jgi:putative DNA primase/helicase
MIAGVSRPDGKIVAVQVTFLDPRGHGRDKSRDRKTIGKLGSGAVRLGAAGEVLGLAEGVETGLAAMQFFGVPVWSCLGSSRMCGLTLPAETRKVILFGDQMVPLHSLVRMLTKDGGMTHIGKAND